jgi:hypothetical protein
LLPGSFPRWLYGQRFEIDEHGHKKQPKPGSSVLTIPYSPDELPKPSQDISPDTGPSTTSELVTAIKEKVASTFKPPVCAECGERLDKKPIVCGNRSHLMVYERKREGQRIRQAKHRAK